jgi:uncharacterized delta-60 repeat protein
VSCKVVVAAAALALLLPTTAPAASLDPGFGAAGIVVTVFGVGDRSSNVNALAVQRDGKIVAAGMAWSVEEKLNGIALARYNADGSLDVDFGADGTVMTDAGDAQSVALQADGKLLLGGDVLARYQANGRPDPTFGIGGTVATDLGIVRVIATRKGIFAVGRKVVGKKDVLVLVRYRFDGTLDRRFGKRGIVTRVGYGPLAAAPAPGGKIVVLSPRVLNPDCGSPPGCVNPDIDIRLLRYLPDGRLDRSFGGDGIVVKRARSHSTGLRALAVQPDGKIIVGGHGHALSGNAPSAFMLVRFREDGNLDRSFGDSGVAIGEVGFGIRALAVDRTGRIIAAGASENLQDFVVARFTPRGQLDAGFGAVTTDFGAYETPWAVAVQPDGAVVAAGQTGTGLLKETNFAVARYR